VGPATKRGVESRLLLTMGKGRGGTYWYFYCVARNRGECDAPYMHTDMVEAAIAEHYGTVTLDPTSWPRFASGCRRPWPTRGLPRVEVTVGYQAAVAV